MQPSTFLQPLSESRDPQRNLRREKPVRYGGSFQGLIVPII